MVDWYDTDWGYRKKITIDSSKVSDDETNLPVKIVTTSDSDLSSNALADGTDILFTDSDGTTLLKFERVAYSAGTSEFWAKVPSVSGSTDTDFYMYYGNAAASDLSDTSNTWPSEHVAVYHLNGANTTTTCLVDDSTSNSNDGYTMGTRAYRDFDGIDDIITVSDHSSIQDIFAGDASVGATIILRSDGEPAFGRIMEKRGNALTGTWSVNTQSESNGFVKLSFWVVFSGTDGSWITSDAVVPLNVPVTFSISYNGSSTTNDPIFYINGVKYTVGAGLTETATPTGTIASDVGDTFNIGNLPNTAGTVDGGISDVWINTSTISDADALQDYQTHDLDYSSFTAWYPLDEIAGTTARNAGSGSAGSGAVTGAAVTFGAPDYGARPVWDDGLSKHLDFDGTDDIITVTDESSIQDIFDGGGSVGFTIIPRSDGEGDKGRILSKDIATADGWLFNVNSEASGFVKMDLYYYFSGGANQWGLTDAVIPLNVPTKISINYNADSASNSPTFFINGVKYTEGSGITQLSTTTGTRDSDVGNQLDIGRNSSGTRTFDGGISDVWLNTSTISDADALLDYQGDLDLTAMVAYYAMDEATGTSVANTGTGGAGAGSVSGATWVTGRISYADRFSSGGIELEGTSSHVRIPHISDLSGASVATVFAVSKQAVLDQAESLFAQSKDGNERFHYLTHTDGNIYANTSEQSDEFGTYDYSLSVTADTIFSTAMMFDGSQTGNTDTLKLYLDGMDRTLSYTGTIGDVLATTTGIPFLIGNIEDGTAASPAYWDGNISELIIYNTAKDADFMSTMHEMTVNNGTFLTLAAEEEYVEPTEPPTYGGNKRLRKRAKPRFIMQVTSLERGIYIPIESGQLENKIYVPLLADMTKRIRMPVWSDMRRKISMPVWHRLKRPVKMRLWEPVGKDMRRKVIDPVAETLKLARIKAILDLLD